MKLHLITEKDELRPAMSYVQVTKETCTATNAYVIGVIPTKDIFDEDFIQKIPKEGMLIHSEDWAKFDKSTIIHWEDKFIKIYYPKKRAVIIQPNNELLDKYPKWQSITEAAIRATGETSKIGLNPVLLLELHKALGFSDLGCRIFYGGANNKAMLIKDAQEYNEAYGVLMPILIDN